MTKSHEIFESKVRPVADTMLKQAAKEPKPGMQEAFYKELQAVNWSLNEYGEIEILDSEGFPLTDVHGWPLTVKETVSRAFERYFEKSNMPETVEQLDKRLKDPNITAKDRIELTEYWLKKHPDSEYFNEKSLQIASRPPKF